MLKYRVITVSAVLMALILFIFSAHKMSPKLSAMPLTETVYTIPESSIDFSFSEEIIRINRNYRKETCSIGIGVLNDLSIWYSFEYLHNGINSPENKLGDSFFKIWCYIDDFYDILHTGFLIQFRIPSGVNAYTEAGWRNVSFGNNEIKIGPVFKIDIKDFIFLHLNLFYVFRQGPNEDFYGGFYFNLAEKETYKNIFGLNPRAENTFLSGSRLKNDYVINSMALNTNRFYPVIPFLEIYFSCRIHEKQNSLYDHLPVEGSGINPVFVSIGGKYFISEPAYFGFYYICNPKRVKNFIKDIFGFDFSLQF
ncbi:MAG: hypothetical protein JW864_03565 [Spirochaetes bacterium]|nr:hypothetical protein [Spirochaetota bacterium]